jgi:hypothetical protein
MLQLSKADNRRRTDNQITKRKRTKGQTTIYKTLHRKLKTEQHELYSKSEVKSSVPEGYLVPDSHVALVVLPKKTQIAII